MDLLTTETERAKAERHRRIANSSAPQTAEAGWTSLPGGRHRTGDAKSDTAYTQKPTFAFTSDDQSELSHMALPKIRAP